MGNLLSVNEVSDLTKKMIFTVVGIIFLVGISYRVDEIFGKVVLGIVCSVLLIYCLVYLANKLMDAYDGGD